MGEGIRTDGRREVAADLAGGEEGGDGGEPGDGGERSRRRRGERT